MSETREIPLSRGHVAIIDADDFERVSGIRWHAAGTKWIYARTGGRSGKKAMPMHRFILNAPEGVHVDHINGDTLDNRKTNLRFATNQQNRWNQQSKRNTASRYKGVTYDKQKRMWQAEVNFQNRRKRVGWYADEVEAAKAYDRIAWLCFGEFARLNFPKKEKVS